MSSEWFAFCDIIVVDSWLYFFGSWILGLECFGRKFLVLLYFCNSLFVFDNVSGVISLPSLLPFTRVFPSDFVFLFTSQNSDTIFSSNRYSLSTQKRI